MDVGEYDYDLPPHLVAQRPAEPRDSARLLVVERGTGALSHRRFADLPEILAPGDLLVANDSRVLPARLRGRKSTGGAVEALLLRRLDDRTWQALLRGRVRAGMVLTFGPPGREAHARVIEAEADGARTLRFDDSTDDLLPVLGEVPLPPYIHQPLEDPERYQTVYARPEGSAAAPTAGLHFTPALLDRLGRAGVDTAFVTLHVGLDTFRPIDEARVADHPIHREWASLPPETVRAVSAARARGGRVVAVGTTSVRVLETAAHGGEPLGAFEGWTDLYITPGYRFGAVDALVTNFHLPRTTLLVLVSTFAGHDLTRRAYREAVDREYRFYSFGDAMLVL